jgi:4-hydroxy-2-oxoheptanedioate aldolase
MNRPNPLRRSLAENRKLFGCWLELSETADMMRGIARTDAAAVVRVPANDPIFIKRLLDQGPDGIMIPMIETSAESKEAVAACRYHPRGKRGWAAGVARASLYGPGCRRANE